MTCLLPNPTANVSVHQAVPVVMEVGLRFLLCVVHQHPSLLWGQLPAAYRASLGSTQASGSKETKALFFFFSAEHSPAPALGSKQVPAQLLCLPLHLIWLDQEKEPPSAGLYVLETPL